MKIQDQNIQLYSQHYASETRRVERVHETFKNGQLATRDSLTISSHQEQSSEQGLKTSNNPVKLLTETPSQTLRMGQLPNQDSSILGNPRQRTINESQTIDEALQLPKKLREMIAAIEALMERLTGKEHKLKVYGYHNGETAEHTPYSQTADFFNGASETPVSKGERLVLKHFFQEQEHTQFQASGHVMTSDGRKIEFNLNTQMAREFTSQVTIEQQSGVVMKDPLVVNLTGQPARLTVDKFSFDVDADGQHDQISFVTPESGFLAFDKNQDGMINNGTELFGALTGDGFSELSQYDEDRNGWIDENDTIFSQLQIWQKDQNGFDRLSGLLEMNIGAIYLDNISTEFSLKDQNNQQHGQIKSSGVYLQENGGIGTVQQIDLVV